MKRLVVNTRTYRPERTQAGAFCIIDTLECGHEVYNKGSAGYAKHRKCEQCLSWLMGTTKYKRIGNQEEKWDSKTLMPYWEDSKSSNDN
ncbi:hypothetical protein ES703_101698 [subsurface metagenome]